MRSTLRRWIAIASGLSLMDWALGLFRSSIFGLLSVLGAWLASEPTKEIVFYGFLVFLLAFASWWNWKAPLRTIRNPWGWRQHLPWGILWNFEGFLGAGRKDGVTYVSCFQINGMNRSSVFIRFKSARIVSCITGNSIPVRIRTTSGYVSPDKANPIPEKAKFYMQGLFYDPNTTKSGDREGLREDEFLRDFSEFIFEAEYGTKQFSKRFNEFHINAQLDRLKPTPISTPRVTAQS